MCNVQVSRAPAGRVGQQVLVAIGVGVGVGVVAIVVTTHDDAVGLVMGKRWRLKSGETRKVCLCNKKTKGGCAVDI